MLKARYFKFYIKSFNDVHFRAILDHLGEKLYIKKNELYKIQFHRLYDHEQGDYVIEEQKLNGASLIISKTGGELGSIGLSFTFTLLPQNLKFFIDFSDDLASYSKSHELIIGLSSSGTMSRKLNVVIDPLTTASSLIVESLQCNKLVVNSSIGNINIRESHINYILVTGRTNSLKLEEINKDTIETCLILLPSIKIEELHITSANILLDMENSWVNSLKFTKLYKESELVIRNSRIRDLTIEGSRFAKTVLDKVVFIWEGRTIDFSKSQNRVSMDKLNHKFYNFIQLIKEWFKVDPKSSWDECAVKIIKSEMDHLVLENLSFSQKNPFLIPIESFKNLVCVNVNFAYDGFAAYENEDKLIIINQYKRLFNETKNIEYARYFEALERTALFHNGHKSLPMKLSYITNRFGLDLLLPFMWILLILCLEVFTILAASNCEHTMVSNFGVFSGLLNPVVSPKTFIDFLPEVCQTSFYVNIVYLSVNIYRIIYGFLIFQFIRAFRFRYNLQS